MIKEINKIEDLQELVKSGFRDFSEYGDVNVKEKDDLLLFTYGFDAEKNNRWNFLERISRGLILNKNTGEVVARPFSKFFNYGQSGRFTKSPIKYVNEKLDGSMGILYRENGEYKIATKGSFNSDQAIWATDKLKEYLYLKDDIIRENYTLIFEIIHRNNRIVIPYDDNMTGLHLLAIRNRKTGEYVDYKYVKLIADYYGFGLPKKYKFSSIDEIIDLTEKLPFTEEGFVVDFEDESKFKFKGIEYLKIHRLISNISLKYVAEVYYSGTLNEYKRNLPDEFLDEIIDYENHIEEKIDYIYGEFTFHYSNAPKDSRKDFALYVNEHCKEISSYMFALLDEKGDDFIKKMFFKKEYGITDKSQKIENLKSKTI